MEATELESKAKRSGLSDEEMSLLEFEHNKKRRNELENKSSLSDSEMNELENLHKSIKVSSMDYDKTGPTEAILKNAADSFLMGHYPQVAGAVKSVIEDRPYVASRDEEIERMKRLEEEEPTAAMVGKGAGILGQFAVPQLAASRLAQGVTTGGRALMGMAEGAANVLAQNPGDTKGVVDPIQIEERAKNFSENPILSSASVLIPAIGPISKGMLGDSAAKMAYEASGPKKNIAKEAIRSAESSPKQMESVGRYALDEGIVGPMSTYEKMYSIASKKADDIGKQISSIIDRNNDALGRFVEQRPKDPEVLKYLQNSITEGNKEKILAEIGDSLKFEPGADAAVEQVRKYLNQVIPDGSGKTLGAKDLQSIRVSMNNFIKWGKDSKDLPSVQKAYKILRSKVDDALNNEIDLTAKTLGQNDRLALRKLRDEYTKATIISDASLDNYASSVSKKINPTQAAGAGAVAGSIIKPSISGAATGAAVGAGGAVLNNMMSAGRGASTYANILDSLQNAGRIPGGMSRMSSDFIEKREPSVGGFPMSQTMQIGPNDYLNAKNGIEQDPSLSTTEKAKRLNLMHTYKRIYIGQ